jgi:hypothetical protein
MTLQQTWLTWQQVVRSFWVQKPFKGVCMGRLTEQLQLQPQDAIGCNVALLAKSLLQELSCILVGV